MVPTIQRWLGVALVAAAPSAMAAPCLPGTLADYLALGSGCQIGATTFTGFATIADPSGAPPVASNEITVTPLVSATSPGLVFGLDASVASGEVLSTLIAFQVLAAVGESLNGGGAALEAGATGDGVALLIEDFCVGGLFASPPLGCAGVPLALVVSVTELAPFPADSLAFGPADLVDVVVNLVLDGGPLGAADMGTGTVRFFTTAAPAPVHEPATMPLVAAALLASIVIVRRRGPRR